MVEWNNRGEWNMAVGFRSLKMTRTCTVSKAVNSVT
jgi:hypothetical protein